MGLALPVGEEESGLPGDAGGLRANRGGLGDRVHLAGVLVSSGFLASYGWLWVG